MGWTPPPAAAAPLIRALLLLMAAWNLLAALALLTAGSGSGALSVADAAGQRLAGAQMLVLSPVYLLIAWKPSRYGGLLWLPFAGQAALCLSVAYSVLTGDTRVGDGILAIVVSGVLASLLAVAWVSDRRSSALQQYHSAMQDDEEQLEP